ncbi:MAG: hypothetical protein H7A41_08700 [Chlamydiales bacterium]|nr:hypothetical protein [Chlamydiia bacterium]MCP5505213.1 hypothetical protein [Chlamydiales bacterium]
MESYHPSSVDRVITSSASSLLDTLEENYFGVQADKQKAAIPSAPCEREQEETPEFAHVRLGAQNLTDRYVERVEVRSHTQFGEKTHLGTDFHGRSEYVFRSSFRQPNHSELLIAAKRSDKIFFTRVKVSGDTAININVEDKAIVAEIYSFNAKDDFWAKTSRVIQGAYVLNECSAQSIDDIHPLM